VPRHPPPPAGSSGTFDDTLEVADAIRIINGVRSRVYRAEQVALWQLVGHLASIGGEFKNLWG